MNNFNARIMNISNKTMTHQHEHAQIVIPLTSNVYIETNYGSFIIDNNSLGFIPSNCYHDFRSDLGEKSLVIDIPPNMLKRNDLNKFKASSKVILDDSLHLLVQLIIREIDIQPRSDSLKYLFFYLYDKIIEKNIFKSIDYINKHYNEDININILAEMEHYNVNYYSEWFKKQMGMNPKDYIQNLRIEKSKELLVTTKYSVSDISSQVGYSHSSSFCRVFKIQTGLSPTVYRKNNK